MLAQLIKGFTFGLTTAPFCALTCAPIIVPLMASRGRRGVRANAVQFGQFLGGRFLGYVVFGAVAGAVGGMVTGGLPRWASGAAWGAIGLAMLVAAAGRTSESRLCLLSRRISGSHLFPVLLGALTGINLCPPFLLAVTEALRAGGAVAGATLFVGFFAGTSVVMVPAVFAGMASAWRAVRSLGTVLCAFAGLFFITLSATAFLPPPAPTPPDAREATYVELLPAAADFQPAGGAVPYHVGRDENGEPVGYVFNTHAVAPKATEGFNGPVPVLVGLDTAGRVTAVKGLKNDEDPSFHNDVLESDYLRRFIGATPDEAGRIDAVTGATWTSNGVIRGVAVAGRKVAEAAGIDVGAMPERADDGPFAGVKPVHAALVLIVAAAVFGRARRIGWLRHVTMIAAIGTLGFWWSNLLSVKHFGDLLRDAMALPGMLMGPRGADFAAADVINGVLRALPLILGVGVAFFLGRVWCGWVCPFGALTEYLGRLMPRRLRLRVPGRMDRAVRRVKVILLVLTPVLLAATGVHAFMAYEPFNDTLTLSFLRADYPLHKAVWLGFLALASLVSLRFYCKYLCPVGAGLGFVSAHRVVARRLPAGCRRCPACGLDCMVAPEEIAPPDLPEGECLACDACSHCPRFPVDGDERGPA